MNAPVIHKSILKLHGDAVEKMFAPRFVGQLPRGCVGHVDVRGPDALEFLAESLPGLNLFDLAGAEIELGNRLGRCVGIVTIGGLKDREAEELPKLAQPL